MSLSNIIILLIYTLLTVMAFLIAQIAGNVKTYKGGAPKKKSKAKANKGAKATVMLVGLPKLVSQIVPLLRTKVKNTCTVSPYNEDLNPTMTIHLAPNTYKTSEELTNQKSLALQHASMDEWVTLLDVLGKNKIQDQVAYFDGSAPRSSEKITQEIFSIIQDHINSRGVEKLLLELTK